MRYSLENDCLKIEIDLHGAELKSVVNKKTGFEYMWQGDPKFWGRTSPVLFPFVGSVKNKTYSHNGKTYEMGQHGFARDMDFVLESQSDNSLFFVLRSNEETIAKYPFAFALHIGYELVDNTVKVLWKVENTDNQKMYFSIGAHPAFCCPIHNEEDKIGYGLLFDGLTDAIHHHGNTKDGMAIMEDEVLELEQGRVIFTKEFFDRCTYMIEGAQTGGVSLLDKQGNAYVKVIFDTPLFAIWSPEEKNAPFVCIEPWFGRCDSESFTGELKDRDYEQLLEEKGIFDASYEIKYL